MPKKQKKKPEEILLQRFRKIVRLDQKIRLGIVEIGLVATKKRTSGKKTFGKVIEVMKDFSELASLQTSLQIDLLTDAEKAKNCLTAKGMHTRVVCEAMGYILDALGEHVPDEETETIDGFLAHFAEQENAALEWNTEGLPITDQVTAIFGGKRIPAEKT